MLRRIALRRRGSARATRYAWPGASRASGRSGRRARPYGRTQARTDPTSRGHRRSCAHLLDEVTVEPGVTRDLGMERRAEDRAFLHDDGMLTMRREDANLRPDRLDHGS